MTILYHTFKLKATNISNLGDKTTKFTIPAKSSSFTVSSFRGSQHIETIGRLIIGMNKGQVRDSCFVPCREVKCPLLEVFDILKLQGE